MPPTYGDHTCRSRRPGLTQLITTGAAHRDVRTNGPGPEPVYGDDRQSMY